MSGDGAARKRASATVRWYLVWVAALGLAYAISPVLLGDAGIVLANKILPPVFLVLCGLGMRRLIREDHFAEWSPLLWFLVASALYFGLGPLVHYFASDASVAYVSSFFSTDDAMVYRANLLNVWGTWALLLGHLGASHSRLLGSLVRRLRLVRCDSDRWIWLFAAVGLPVRYGIALPDRFGVLPFVPPSSIIVFETFVSALVFLLTKRILEGGRRFLPLLGGLLVAEGLAASLTFSKLEFLSALLPVLLGVIAVRRRFSVLVLGMGALAFVYVAVLPMMDFGRKDAGLGSDTGSRVVALRTYAGGDDLSFLGDMRGVQKWWTRLDYAPVQAFVMREFDEGRPGGTFGVLKYAFVPRFIWAAKPLVTTSEQLTFLINGTDSSKSAPTVFGECYWAGGWAGVVLGGLYVGIVFWLFAQVVGEGMARGEVGILPLAFVGVRLGLRPDDYFVTAFVSSMAIVAFLFLVLRLLSAFAGAPKARRRRKVISRHRAEAEGGDVDVLGGAVRPL